MRNLLWYAPLFLAACVVAVPRAEAVTPNPLQDAYWRFEEGTPGLPVGAPNSVLDSANANHLQADSVSPIYSSTVAPLPLRSGAPNNVAMSFAGTAASSGLRTFSIDDTSTDRIENGMIGGTVAPGITGFTLEAAFRPNIVNAFQGIVAKNGAAPQGPEATLALKVRGDNSNLQAELIDLSGVRRDVQSLSPLVAGNWYAAAAVNDGSTMSLYLNDGSGYVLQGTTPVSGALYQGTSGNDWGQTWSVGRASFGGFPADYFDGIIDEVRLTNRALSSSEFLFVVPEPGTIALGALALVGCVSYSIRRRRA